MTIPFPGPFGKTVELLEKMITTLKNETILKTAPILPVLIDVMLRLPARLDFVLKLIEVVSVGIRIEICEPHLERLLTYCFDILKETSVSELSSFRICFCWHVKYIVN